MDRRALGLGFSLGVLGTLAACTAQQRAAVIDLVDAACVVVDVFVGSPEASQVCAYEKQLRPFVEEVLKAKGRLGAGGEPVREVCVPMPEGDAFRELRPDDVTR